MTVLDASAIIAALLDEPARDEVEELLRAGATAPRVSAVNLGEIVDQMVRVRGRKFEDVLDRLMWLAQTARSPEARAIALLKLRATLVSLPEVGAGQLAGAAEGTAHLMALAVDIRRFLERPWDPQALPRPFTPPPGMPIGQEP